MEKALIFCMGALMVFTAAVQSGCGRGGGSAPEETGGWRSSEPRDARIPASAEIPVYPGAEKMEAEMLPGSMEQGLNISAYKTPDSLSRVYSFYSGALEESGFDAESVMSIGNGSHFVFKVSLGGRDVAVINGALEAGNTVIAVVRPE